MKKSAKASGLFRSAVITGGLFALVFPCGVWAEVTVMVQPASTGGFLVSAGNLKGVTGGEIRFDYTTDDPAASPAAVAMGNNTQAVLRSSGENFGTVVITITGRKPANGYVNLARINLVDQNGNPGRIIPPYYALFTRENGGQETARVNIANPDPAGRSEATTGAPDGKNMTTAEYIKKRQQELAARPAPVTDAELPAVASTPATVEMPRETVVLVASPVQKISASPAKAAPPVFRRIAGVLDRFRSYTGEWSSAAIERLFAPVSDHEFRQVPAVVIADGVAEVQVSVRSTGMDEVINSFVISGGHVTSAQLGEAGEWLLSIIPGEGALNVSVTMYTEKSIIEYPLTVAPQSAHFFSREEAGKILYLREFVTRANELAERHSSVNSSSAAEAPSSLKSAY